MNKERERAFNLGLAISEATMLPGQCRSREELAAYVTAAGAPTSRERIRQIEERALRKLRHPEHIKKLK